MPCESLREKALQAPTVTWGRAVEGWACLTCPSCLCTLLAATAAAEKQARHTPGTTALASVRHLAGTALWYRLLGGCPCCLVCSPTQVEDLCLPWQKSQSYPHSPLGEGLSSFYGWAALPIAKTPGDILVPPLNRHPRQKPTCAPHLSCTTA